MILKFIELSCDDCFDVIGPVSIAEGVREVRKIAKTQGWVYRNQLDLCPLCVEKQSPWTKAK